MKKYIAPIIKVEAFDVCDILMVSTATTQTVSASLTDILDNDIVFKSSNAGSEPIIGSGAAFYLN